MGRAVPYIVLLMARRSKRLLTSRLFFHSCETKATELETTARQSQPTRGPANLAFVPGETYEPR